MRCKGFTQKWMRHRGFFLIQSLEIDNRQIQLAIVTRTCKATPPPLTPPLKGGRRETEPLHRLISKRTAPFSGLLLDPRLRSPPPLLPSFLPSFLSLVSFFLSRGPIRASMPRSTPRQSLSGVGSQGTREGRSLQEEEEEGRKKRPQRHNISDNSSANEDGPNGNCGFLQLLVEKKENDSTEGVG